MKKVIALCLVSLLVLALSACNSTAEPTTGKEVNNKSELTLQEVYEKAIERQNTLESVSAVIKMNQKIELNDGTEAFEMGSSADMTMDMVSEPLAMYVDGAMTMADPATGENMNVDMEMYMSEEGFFMHDPETKQWMKLPSEQFAAIAGQTVNQVNASEQLKQFESFIEDFTFEQTETEYVLKLNAASDKFSEFILEQMQVTEMMGVTEEEQKIVENMKFDNINYVIKIDKETFDIHAMDTIFDITIDVEGKSMKVATDAKIAFNNFNEVEAIKIPQEVIDQAVEVQY